MEEQTTGNKRNTRAWLRSRGDALVARLPISVFRMFLKTFKTHPELAEAAGFHVYPRTFYSPLPLMEEIERSKLAKPRLLPGIDLRIVDALTLIEKLKPLSAELDSIPYDRQAQEVFWFNNGSFTDFDAAVLYSALRYLKPKRYVELGCGFSSMMSSRALHRNHQEGTACDAVYADPEPRLPMGGNLAYGKIIEKRVQELPLNLFTELQAGDVLFIDTSHVLKIQSDVELELLRIVPSLAVGAWVHIHDIFTPYDYPEDWVFCSLRLSANEQYAVECLLSGGDRYQVEIPLHMLVREHLAEMQAFFPHGRNPGQSLWMRKVR